VKKEQKETIVTELADRLKAADTVLVADYRGLTMPQIDALRTRLLESGARFTVVKNTLTRRAAEAAGAEALLTLLEGPTAIAFLEADGDMLAAAKALADMARESKVLAIRGGVLQGKVVSAEEVETLAALPPMEILRGQVLGAIVAPVTALLGLVTAPLQNLYGLLDARIEQLGVSDTGTVSDTEPQVEAAPEPEPAAEAEPAAEEEPGAEAERGAESVPAAESVGEEATQATAPAVATEETDQEESK
jgi:large subunit ribosomal protein L10